MYDYIGHFEKLGLEWYQKDLKLYYGIKIDKKDNKKIEKRLTLDRLTRQKNLNRWKQSLEHEKHMAKK